MSRRHVLGGASVLLSLSLCAQASEFDVLEKRALISANTVSALGGSDVSGGWHDGTSGPIRMFYDARDATPGYAGRENFWNQDWSLYLSAESALGPKGPLGYTGPLSSVGPLSNASWSWSWGPWSPANYSAWVGHYVWDNSSSFGSSSPFGALGPLGSYGPLTVEALYTDMYHLNEVGDASTQESSYDDNDFPHQLDPAGVWGVLGPAGPLGALGPLGPLGPLGYGASGAVVTDGTTGDYRSGSTVVRTLDVPYTTDGSVVRRFDLVELYPRADLILRQESPSRFVNDTSFTVNAVSGSCTLDLDERGAHTFYFKSRYDQWVSVVLTNVNAYAELDFDVSIKADPSNTFGTASSAAAWFGSEGLDFTVDTYSALFYSSAYGLQDFAVFRVRRGEVIKLVVRSGWSSSTGYDACGYLLHVVGSGFREQAGGVWSDTQLFAPGRTSSTGLRTFNIIGKHQRALAW